ncbi:hypothetical protein CMO88_00645 [Candidatus Woesearchaeota archaeon]|nr:hypothetical protein [Candidatus Woesearchaeota archaeon]|tara:strand:- start:8206 stop:9462 length:1257 start_codon:yes stop_codon:yes gene_type:complete
MQKKGAVEVDWIFSIAIFLIYLTLFFLYLAPFTTEQPEASDTLLANVESNLRENATWHVQRIPIFTNSNISGIEPLVVPFLLNWKNLSLADNTSFFRQENKLLFKSKLNEGPNMKWIVSSDEIYPQPSMTALDATKSEVTIDSKRFKAEFDGLLKSALHFEKHRISGLNISIDSGIINTESAVKENNFSDLAAKYKLISDTVNHTTFVVKDFSRLFNYVESRQKFEPHNFTIKMILHNYTDYFIDNSLSGPLNFTKEVCKIASDYIDFYDSLGGISFISDGASMSFCTGNNSVSLSMYMNLNNETNYNILFHSGDYNSTLKYIKPYTINTGMIENLSGISMVLMEELNQSDYTNLKKAWNFPSSREFTFELLNDSNEPLINYTYRVPGLVNVFVKEFEEIVLDKYGNKVKRKLRLKGW